MRKLIAFDEDMFAKLSQLGRDRMATIQELADEAFDDVLKKHGIPRDLKDALRKSVTPSQTVARATTRDRENERQIHEFRPRPVRARPARGA